jgi:hypothetical protein
MKVKVPLTVALLVLAQPAFAATPNEILANNTRAIVYLEVNDAANQFIDGGTGFIVSHDGFVVTAAHLKVQPSQRLWAVIGQREGTRFPLQFREADEATDVALWQLPQSASCRYSVTLGTLPFTVPARAVALGFPGRDGLTPALVNIINLATDEGFYRGDGFLRGGYSGGPVFNEDGKVIATVHSGTPAGGNNDFVPVAASINLLKKRGVRAGVDIPVPFENSCYTFCRATSHGIEKWTSEGPWGPVNSGELPGGHTRKGECDKLIAAALAGHPDSQIDLLPGEGVADATGMWEDSHKDVLGEMHYTYYCKGILRSGPIFAEKQSPACGLWN